MRNRLALAAGAFFFSLAAFGCGAAQNEATAADEGTLPASEKSEDEQSEKKDDATPAATTAGDNGASTTPAGTDTPIPAPPADPSGPQPQPPPVIVTPTPTTPGVPGTVACPSGGLREADGNETPETATNLGASLSFCGSLSSAADVDHLSFILPADAKSFGWNGSFSSAGATITLTAEGVTKSTNEAPPWFPGKRYVIKVTGTVALDYAVTMTVGR